MSLRDKSWFDRGKIAYHEGKSTDDAPYPIKTPEGQDWFNGWNEAADEDDVETTQNVGVYLKQVNGQLRLMDQHGRVLGTQLGVTYEQKEDQSVAHVSFYGVTLK